MFTQLQIHNGFNIYMIVFHSIILHLNIYSSFHPIHLINKLMENMCSIHTLIYNCMVIGQNLPKYQIRGFRKNISSSFHPTLLHVLINKHKT